MSLCENKKLASVANKALGHHLWYLIKELVFLTFKKMTSALQKPASQHPEKQCTLGEKVRLPDKVLFYFVTASSRIFFTKLLDSYFLEVDPSE